MRAEIGSVGDRNDISWLKQSGKRAQRVAAGALAEMRGEELILSRTFELRLTVARSRKSGEAAPRRELLETS
jgi:hypothetical protein